MDTLKGYIYRVLIGLDQFSNSILNGAPDETISSRCGRNKDKWYWNWLYRLLDWLQNNHCERAIESEKARLHEPEELR